jgi:polar amino acid transport system substrate-binding protein
MKHKSVCFFMFLLLVLANSARAKTLVITGGEETNSIVRVAQLVMTDIYQKLGYHVKFRHCPLKRALMAANAGIYDAEVARVKGLEAKFPNLIRIPVAIYQIEGVAFTKNKDFPIDGWESLRPYKIGVLRGVQFAEKGTENLNREISNSLISMFKKLDAERVDVVVEAKLNGIITIKQLKLHDSILILNPPLETIELFHYVHKKNEHLVPKLTEILRQMKQNGSLDELIRKSEQKVIATVTGETNFKE